MQARTAMLMAVVLWTTAACGGDTDLHEIVECGPEFGPPVDQCERGCLGLQTVDRVVCDGVHPDISRVLECDPSLVADGRRGCCISDASLNGGDPEPNVLRFFECE